MTEPEEVFEAEEAEEADAGAQLPVGLTTTEVLNLDPKFVYEVALMVEPGEVVARRWGITPEKWKRIEETKVFQLQVAVLRSEMERTGVTFGTTAGVMAKELLDTIFREAISSETALKDRLDVLRALAKYANFEPKSGSDAPTAPRFSINISLPESLNNAVFSSISGRNTPKNDENEGKKAVFTLDFGEPEDVS